MPSDCISYKSTGYFSKLICNYLAEAETLKPFYNRFPKLESFKAQIEEKSASFKVENRKALVAALKEQYKLVEASKSTLQNIEALGDSNTFTVTTGHQLNLFTGPLYFLHKIVSTINLAKELKVKYPEHDFEEINYFNFKGKKIRWNSKASGAVGELEITGLKEVLELFSQELGLGNNAESLRTLFKNAYLEHNTLSEATFYLANELFKAYGLVVVEANNKALKELFIPYVEKELTEQISYKKVSQVNKQIETLSQDYKIQVNPREINLFYIIKNLRERIVFEDGIYKVLNTKITWSKSDILEEVNMHPQRFSPNVILRPLYQEIILPNLCYIGKYFKRSYFLKARSFCQSKSERNINY